MNRAVVVESDTPFAELSIANPGIADISTLSDKSIYVLGKAPGRTTMTLLGADGRLISNVEVHVTPDIAEFKERLRQILPGEQIEVRTANDGIVLSGTVSSTAKLDRALDLANRYAPERISNLMSVGGTQQVMLKVRFAEMQRSVSKSLSASLAMNGVSSSGRRSIESETGTFLTGSNSISSPVEVQPGTEGAMRIGFSAGSLQFAVLLEALESKGMVRTLAEPNLTALSGQEAKFLAGGEYPIPVSSKEGTVTVEYKPFGVELNFTPVVVDGDIINLTMNAAVSSIDTTLTVSTNGISLNAFKRRETSTTVEMRDGESFAIAGLLQDDFRNLKGSVPWLGD
ncbi:MAG: type II and III secretion system protein family protein, partial [Burkholderiaceae bacterium]|nr:type II and III secretion system protein family protein [Burkholderiaceae bacterium]